MRQQYLSRRKRIQRSGRDWCSRSTYSHAGGAPALRLIEKSRSDSVSRRSGSTKVRSCSVRVDQRRSPAIDSGRWARSRAAASAASDMGSLITPVGPWLAPYQPAQRYYLIDLQRVAPDDLPYRNLLRAVARLEQSRSPQDVMRVVKALQRWLPKRGAEELRRAFADWLHQMAERMAPPGALVPAVRTLEEASMTLVERVAEWPKQWLREGREQGVAEGRQQGVAEGREQGVDQQRALLCRQAAARFDADAATRLAGLLAPIADPERLAEVGDWLVRCETAAAFFARFDPASPSRPRQSE